MSSFSINCRSAMAVIAFDTLATWMSVWWVNRTFASRSGICAKPPCPTAAGMPATLMARP